MKRKLSILFILSVFLSACNMPIDDPDVVETGEVASDEPAAASPSPTSEAVLDPIETLTVCTASLPDSLFPYDGEQSSVKENMLAIIQDGPFDQDGDSLEAVILEKVPTENDGDLRLESVTVQTGQVVVDADGDIVVLASGVTVRPSGCRESECAVTWEGEGTLEMDQMVIEFNLRDDILWSDGEAVNADDSVFSFGLASAPEASGTEWVVEHTDSYTALDDTTVQWVGLPGFTNAEPDRFFWTPLPSHLFTGSETWEEITANETLVSYPLSYGPFVLTSREKDKFTFEANPFYFKSEEGLPVLDEVIFQVVEGGAEEAWALLKSGDCDVLDSSLGIEEDQELLAEVLADEQVEVCTQSSDAWTQLVFGIQPVTYDGVFDIEEGDRPDFFGDERTRLAIALCLDREAILEATTQGLGQLWSSFVSSSQTQLDDSDLISYDPDLGLELLKQVGWYDHDENPETPLQALEVANVPVGTLFSVELLIGQSAFHQDLAEIICSSLQAVGISVNVTSLTAEELYAAGPDGILFGRQFEMALITWESTQVLDCSLYQSWQIPSANNQWIGTNIAGLSDDVYDRACVEASLALPDERDEALLEAELSFLEDLPAVPLLSYSSVMVVSLRGLEESSIGEEENLFDSIEIYMDD